MLDRKTKNIEAGIELLKDREKHNQIWYVFALLFAAVAVISGALLNDVFLCVMGLAILVVALVYALEDIAYKLFIQAKKIMNSQQDQTALLIDVLDELDSLKGKNKKVKK